MASHVFRATPAARAPTARPDASQRRRAVEAIAFVAVWMAAGHLLPISSDGYLLLGIPLTVAFQLLVRRRRIDASGALHGARGGVPGRRPGGRPRSGTDRAR